MSEKEKEIIEKLAEKLPYMTEREKGYLEGTINTAAAMSESQKAGNLDGKDAGKGREDEGKLRIIHKEAGDEKSAITVLSNINRYNSTYCLNQVYHENFS